METPPAFDGPDCHPPPNVLRVLLAQLDPAPALITENVETVGQTLRDHPGAEIAVFPELFLSGYNLRTVLSQGLHPSGSEFDTLCDHARESRTAVVVGVAELGSGALHNSLVCIDENGRLVDIYRKTHLFGVERDVFAPGDSLRCIKLAGIQVAPMICFDLEFPEVARTLGRQEPDLYLAVAANMAPYRDEHRTAARARALENRTPLVYVNRVGHEDGRDFVGGSCVIGPDGVVINEVSNQDNSVITVIDVAVRRSVMPEIDYRQFRRTDLYDLT